MTADARDAADASAPRVHVPIAGTAIAADPTLLFTVALGSCVAVALYAPARRAGALAHVLLPERVGRESAGRPGRSMDLAIPHLVAGLCDTLECAAQELQAKLVGGASMFGSVLAEPSVGNRNVVAARETLGALGVPIVAEDVGGDYGRSVFFHLDDGRVIVRSLRAGTRVL